MLATELKTLPNQLLIEGHTDAAQYSTDADYSNWELSADRANAARRLLQQGGVRGDQVTQVRGYADQMLRVPSNPYDPSNRRITILVKNQGDAPPPKFEYARVANGLPGGTNPAGPPASGKPQTPPPSAPAAAARPAGMPPPAKAGITSRLTSLFPGKKR